MPSKSNVLLRFDFANTFFYDIKTPIMHILFIYSHLCLQFTGTKIEYFAYCNLFYLNKQISQK